ncbi:MAG: 3-phosphoshikimate 1-carboxyvinyltransferase [Solirubrobacteraceae bacterium]|jgi:3-phosphoshikimate 1-carboxyvinyltransferase|nr:3-phosphoshikimate 1-carboxyvinyltransferase [Solirubrobacteraceae bacterium]
MNLDVAPATRLRGTVTAPPDKSISHRAALLGAMASEPVRITGYLDAEDTNSTLAAVEALGALVDRGGDEIVIRGAGLREARETTAPIDVGNAGTLMRLLPGWLAAQEGRSFTLDGDATIRKRPVDRIAAPLRQMGAALEATDERFPPFTVRGARLRSISYEMPVASAQVKSCVLIAGLAAEGPTTVGEPQPSRDHTERMLARLGAAVHRNGRHVTVVPVDELVGAHLHVPGDPSSAAFWLAAAAIVPGAEVRVTNMGTNWTRIGFVRVLERMGADVHGELEEPDGDIVRPEEPVADIEVRGGPLQGTVVEGEEIPLAIDELPLVGLLGCFAEGETIVRGAAELRVKESDRIAAVVDGLNALGGDLEALPDGFVVRGTGGLRGGVIDAAHDHRTAMLGAIAGLASREGVTVVGMDAAAVSYPGFTRDLVTLQA